MKNGSDPVSGGLSYSPKFSPVCFYYVRCTYFLHVCVSCVCMTPSASNSPSALSAQYLDKIHSILKGKKSSLISYISGEFHIESIRKIYKT